MIKADESQQILTRFNDTWTAYPRDKTVCQLFEEQVCKNPEAKALTFTGEQLTYRELNERANRLAHYLRIKGVRPEDLVGLHVEQSVEMIVGMLGILKAGGAYLPLDPAWPEKRLSYILGQIHPRVILTQENLSHRLSASEAHIIKVDSEWPSIRELPAENGVACTNPANLAYVMFTSGSTGTPKGVLVEHRSIVRLVRETNYIELSDGEVFLQLAPVAFDASTFEIWGCLLNGGHLVVMSPRTPSLEELGQALQNFG